MTYVKQWTLYVLQLEQKKWYVGITSQTPEKRFQEHKYGRKSYWTEKYPPIAIVDTRCLGGLNLEDAKAYEDKVTRTYMREKGVNNVRGGSLTSTSDFVVRFGYIFDKDGWSMLWQILVVLVAFGALYIDKFVVTFIPGGIR